MTYREKMRIARWLYRNGPATESEINARFGAKIKDTHWFDCEFFSIDCPDGENILLAMTDENLDNYRAAIQAETIAHRDWVEPIVSILALLLSIAALVVSLTT